MSNFLSPAVVAEMQALFRAGLGVRASAQRLGISRNATRRYFRSHQDSDFKCPCGTLLRNHLGWCAHRVALSKARQDFLSRSVTLRVETIERWLSYANKFETRIRIAFSHLKQKRSEELGRAPEQAASGVEFNEDGVATRVQVVAANQDQTDSCLRQKLSELHPSVRKLCESILDGASLDEASHEADLNPEQLKTILPRLKLFLKPLVSDAAT